MDHTPKPKAAKPQASASTNPDMLFSLPKLLENR
jgi:hypothetical protein